MASAGESKLTHFCKPMERAGTAGLASGWDRRFGPWAGIHPTSEAGGHNHPKGCGCVVQFTVFMVNVIQGGVDGKSASSVIHPYFTRNSYGFGPSSSGVKTENARISYGFRTSRARESAFARIPYVIALIPCIHTDSVRHVRQNRHRAYFRHSSPMSADNGITRR